MGAMMTPSLTMHIHAGESVMTLEVYEDMKVKLTTNILQADLHQALVDSEFIFSNALSGLIAKADKTLQSTH
jgi:hypothetical protein